MVPERRVRLAQPKARLHFEVLVADLDGNRERAATGFGRSSNLARYPQGRTEA